MKGADRDNYFSAETFALREIGKPGRKKTWRDWLGTYAIKDSRKGKGVKENRSPKAGGGEVPRGVWIDICVTTWKSWGEFTF